MFNVKFDIIKTTKNDMDKFMFVEAACCLNNIEINEAEDIC
ncbi:hypothetical protein LMH73_015205 [Vibrio splendidus]|nr:hypothetical protein [Vibrio splendidus]